MRTNLLISITAVIATSMLAIGCGDDMTQMTTSSSNSSTSSSGSASDPQTPPEGDYKAVQAWLGEKSYQAWHCEAAEHGPSAISPHGANRICTNDKLSANKGGEYDVDSAGVEELWDAVGGSVVGYAVYRHVKAGTTGDTWYWYEQVPMNSPAPHDANGIVADGLGTAGPAKDICVGCHGATGIDAMHPGHDFVYTQIP